LPQKQSLDGYPGTPASDIVAGFAPAMTAKNEIAASDATRESPSGWRLQNKNQQGEMP
jgi:hypothetical protein